MIAIISSGRAQQQQVAQRCAVQVMEVVLGSVAWQTHAALAVGDDVVPLGAHDVAAALHARILPTAKPIAPTPTMRRTPILAADRRRRRGRGRWWGWRGSWRRARVGRGRPRRRCRWAPAARGVKGPAGGRAVRRSADGSKGRRLTRQQTARGGGVPSACLVQQQTLGAAHWVAGRAVADAAIHRGHARQQAARPIPSCPQPHCHWGHLPRQTRGAVEHQQAQELQYHGG